MTGEEARAVVEHLIEVSNNGNANPSRLTVGQVLELMVRCGARLEIDDQDVDLIAIHGVDFEKDVFFH